MKIISWNICFDNFRPFQRYKNIIDIIINENVDVCCLQECNNIFINFIINNKIIIDRYRLSRNYTKNYCNIILAKKELNMSFKEFNFYSNMGRKLVVCYNNDFLIGTVHLESLDNHEIRKEQLIMCDHIFNSFNKKYKLLCGDFNFCSESNFNYPYNPTDNLCIKEIMYKFYDIWSDSPKEWTFDYTTSKMVKCRKQMRLDRILINDRLKTMLRNKYLIGKDILTSDHHGLVIEF